MYEILHKNEMHGIKVATIKSGLSAHVIRMWEKRHNAVEPERTTTNRRVYSDTSIQRLVQLADLTRNGHSIGLIANLSDLELTELHSSITTIPVTSPAPKDDYDSIIKKSISAISEFDQSSLEQLFDLVIKKDGYSALIEKLLVPLIHHVGELWHSGDLTTAEEHAATSFIKDYLSATSRSFTSYSDAPKVLITTPSGQLHELGAVIAASQARKLGWQVVYLGTSLPADEIAGAAEKVGARAVILSVIYPLDDPKINSHLSGLRAQLDPRIPIIVGGARSALYSPTMEKLGITQLGQLSDLASTLTELRSSQATQTLTNS